MSRMLTRDYKAVLSAVVSSMPRRPAVQVAVVDFEKGMWKGIRLVLPGVTLEGCCFHFNQALWRRIQKLGLAKIVKQIND